MKITTKFQKTVQENQFEPIVISCEIEKDVKDYELEDELVAIREYAKNEVTIAMKQWLKD